MDGLKRPRHLSDDEHHEKRPRLTESSEQSSLSRSTHDTSLTSIHVPNMNSINVDAGQNARLSYDNVHALLLVWEQDEPDVRNEVSSLEDAFKSLYRFSTETWLIKSAKPDRELKGKVVDFLHHNDSPANLVIMYYIGNAKPNPKVGEAPIWTSRRESTAMVQSGGIQALFEECDCDALLLYDCLNVSRPLGQSGQGFARQSVSEVLAAGAFDPATSEAANTSFTHALVDELVFAAKNGPVRVGELHTRLIKRMSIVKPRGRGRPPKEPQYRPIDEQQLPLHYWISEATRSVNLAPLALTVETPGTTMHLRSRGLSAPTPVNEAPSVNPGPVLGLIHSGGPAHILLCLRVPQETFQVSDWGTWLAQAQRGAHELIRLEYFWAGFSEITVLRVPLAIWHLLPDCPSSNFAGFTIIGDIAEETLVRIEATLASKLGTEPGPDDFARMEQELVLVEEPLPMGDEDGYSLRISPKKSRKALPTGRKLLPSEPMALSVEGPYAPVEYYDEGIPLPSPTERTKLPSARKPVKIIRSTGQLHYCNECNGIGFKDEEGLQNHIRKQHTRPFHCVFCWAGCDSTFASKNEWKRHVMSQHILLYYWLCQQDACAKVVNTLSNIPGKLVETNGNGRHQRGPTLPNGAIFNRKDLYTQHLRRMHTPQAIKKAIKAAKQANKTPSGGAIQEWEERLRDLQQIGLKERCQLPTYMKCPAAGCDLEFNGLNAWDDRMEHVAKHLEKASAGKEPTVVFGGSTDPTLTQWATRPEVGIVKRMGANGWQLDNPLRPELIGGEPSASGGRERSKSVIEVAEDGDHEGADDEP